MPIPRNQPTKHSRRHLGKRWRPEYLRPALGIFLPVGPWRGPLKGVYHCVPASEITAEEVTGRKGGEQ